MKKHIATLAVSFVAATVQAQSTVSDVQIDQIPFLSVYDKAELILAPDFFEYNAVEFGQSVFVRNGQVIVTVPNIDLELPLPFELNVGQVEIYDIETGQILELIEPETARLNQSFGQKIGVTDQFAWITSHATPSVIDIYDADLKNLLRTIELDSYTSIHASSGYGDRVCVVLSSPDLPVESVAVLYNLSDGTSLTSFEHGSAGFVDTDTQSVAMDSEQIAILNMDFDKDKPFESPGRIDVYNASTYELEYTIRPEESSVGFGMNIEMNSRYIAVGNANTFSGSDTIQYGNIELYDRANGELIWRFATGDTNLQYANTIAMNERFVAVGSMWASRVYLIDIQNPDQVLQLGYREDLFLPRSRFGSSLSMDDDWIAVGAPNAGRDGAVLIYNIACRADMDGDARYTVSDLDEFIRLYGDRDPRTDLNGDGVHNYFDISKYLELLGDGCL